MQTLVALALIMGIEGRSPDARADEPAPPSADDRLPGASLRAYLRRPLPRSARFLDHGVIALRTAGGAPHRYRLELQVGLFDHVSVGVTAHWLPGQRVPQIWPVGSIAFVRWLAPSNVGLEIGAHYRPVLFPPPAPEHFMPQTHLGLMAVVLSSGLFSAGLDLGVAHTRVAMADPADTMSFRRRSAFGGGAFARLGNRRAGLSADALAVLSPDPLLVFELAVDLRFGAFEERPRGGWSSP